MTGSALIAPLRALLPILLLADAWAARAAETVPPPALPPSGLWIASDSGAIRVLDKQKAQSRLIPLHVGQSVTFGTLSVTLRACMTHAPTVPEDAAGFLVVTDSSAGEPGFDGWMLQHEPFAAMLQSPVYGVRLAGCAKPTEAALAAAPPPPPAPAIPAPGATTPAAIPGAPVNNDASQDGQDLMPDGSDPPPPASGTSVQ